MIVKFALVALVAFLFPVASWGQNASPEVVTKPESPATPIQPDAWQPLFDGESLDDWTASENKDSSKVVDGEIVVGGGERSHLFYSGPVSNHDFQNFQLKLKVKAEPKANSGVYFHTKFQEEGWPDQG
jgi:hypothetical protein